MILRKLLLIPGAFLALVAPHATGVPITFEFSGSVTSLTGDGTYFSDLGIQIGDTFSGKVTYETTPTIVFSTSRTADSSTNPNLDPSLDGEVVTEIRSAPTTDNPIAFTDVVFQTSSGNIAFDGNYGTERTRLQQSNNEFFPYGAEVAGSTFDTFSVLNFDAANSGRQQLFRIVDQLEDTLLDLGTYPDTTGFEFVDTIPDISDLIFARYFARELDANNLFQVLDSRLTSIESVPEPQILLLLAAGLLGLRIRRV